MEVMFWLAAAAAVLLGLGVILARQPVHAAIALVGVFLSLGVLFLLLHLQFLGIVEVLVYAGAIMVLFLFVITLLTSGRQPLEERRETDLPAQLSSGVGLVALLLALLVYGLVGKGALGVPPHVAYPQYGDLIPFGAALFTQYLFPFELTALVLLVAAIGVILLGRERRSGG